MRKSNPRQLLFAFAESPKGDGSERKAGAPALSSDPVHTADSSDRSETTPLAATGNTRLLELVAAPSNLRTALANVVQNRGAPGVDRQTVSEVEDDVDRLLPLLHHALLSETYMPGDIRRVWIPKPGGGQRGLGIPNVVDRWVQQAVLQVLEPIFEPTFHNSSHGFRPRRGAQTAIAEAVGYLRHGHRYTVDMDLEKFFDKVHHQRLLDRLAQRVPDRRIVRLVRLMLRANVVLPNGIRVSSEEGAPQGGPLSPLLSNIVLDELDWELERRGHRFVRYADDCNIYVRSERAGLRVFASICRFIERRLRLTVNAEKSAVDLAPQRHFLGFRLGASRTGYVTIHLSKRTLARIDARIREMTRRNWGRSLADCLEQLDRYLRGWMGYFRLCTKHALRTLRNLSAHIRRRLRAIIVRQQKRPRYLFRHLLGRGVSRASAWKTAFSRRGIWWQSKSAGMNRAYPNAWFALRLPSLEDLWYQNHYDWRPHVRTSS